MITQSERRWSHRRSIVCGAASTMLLVSIVGCSSNEQTSTPTTVTIPAGAGTTALSTESSTTVLGQPSIAVTGVDATTLAEVYGLLDVATASEQTTLMATNIPEAEVAECMSRAGFEYAQGLDPAAQVALNPQYALPPAEFAAKYGFGVAAQTLGKYPPQPPDPNAGYLASLSPGQQNAYNAAFFPCRGGTPERIAHSNAVNIALEQFRGVLGADSRVVAATTAWSDCLAASGFRFATRMSMLESFYSRMNSGISHDQLEQLFVEEVAVAVANVPCDAAYRAVYRAVVLERIGEYESFFAAAVASGAAPDAQG